MSTRKVLFAVTALTLALASAACGTAAKPEPTPEPTTIVEGTPVLFFFADDEGVDKLRQDMEAGRVPVECDVLYDESGARPEVILSDPEDITEVYDRLSQMIVLEEGEAFGMTDSYHHVVFTLQDGTTVVWSFEGTGTLCRGRDLYPVSDEGGLWPFVRQLQEPLMDDGA